MSHPLRTSAPPAPDPRWLRALLAGSPVALFAARDALLYASPAWEALLGYAPAELVGRRLSDLAHPDSAARVRAWERAGGAPDGEPMPLEAGFTARDGCILWLELQAACVPSEVGPLTVGAALDVTERHRWQQELSQNEHWFRALAETTATTILVYGTDRILYANRACEVLTGYSQEELLQMPAWRLPHPDHQEMTRVRVAARLRGEPVPGRYELKLLTKDGQIRWVDFTGGVVRVAGEPMALGTAFDITERKLVEIALRESNERLELAQRGAGIFTWEWDLRSDTLLLPEHAATVLGTAPEALWTTGAAFLEAVAAEDQPQLAAALARCFAGDEDLSVQFRLQSPDGRMRWISERGRMLTGADGAASRIIGVAQDISKRKQAEEALEQERERAQVTLASIGDGVIRTDARGLVDYLNPVAERLTGWSAAEAAGKPLTRVLQVVDEVAHKPIADPVERCLREGRVVELPGPALLVRRDGVEFVIRDSVAPIRDRHGAITGSVVVFKDVTELRGMEREVRFLARHDPLTGLPNRREFERHLARAIEGAQQEGREHALLYIDLDEFKLINDTCGHLAGDELLKQVASELARRLRPDDVLARLGGDEFGVLLEDTRHELARPVAEALHAHLAELRFAWEDGIYRIGASIGLVPITAASGGLAPALSAADAACYVAKEQGRNRIHEWQPDDLALAERYGEMQWIHRIARALEEERFVLYHQPIQPLGADGREPPMCEFLLRLLDERGEVIGPSAFIAAAERYGLIGAVDRWVVRAALAALVALTAADDRTYFAINISGQSLGDEAFLEYVLAELRASGVPAGRLCFEITETAAVANLARALRFIAALKGLGCRFVLDDFGSGLSSFAYLKNLPVDYLKIDGEFVRGMTAGSVERALVASINQIGHLLGIRTIAESVEDPDTLAAVRELGIDYAQGFGVSPPQPLPVLPE